MTLGDLSLEGGHRAEALSYYKACYDIRLRAFGPSNPMTKTIKGRLNRMNKESRGPSNWRADSDARRAAQRGRGASSGRGRGASNGRGRGWGGRGSSDDTKGSARAEAREREARS